MSLLRRYRTLLIGVALLGASNAALFSGCTDVRAAASIMLCFVMPGWLVGRLLCASTADLGWIAVITVGAASGLGLGILVGLALAYIPGPIPRLAAVLAFDVLCAALFVAERPWRPDQSRYNGQRSASRVDAPALAILGIAAALRLANLGYSEFQGDEVAVVHLAAAAVQGEDDALFLHKKGPAEVLVPAVHLAIAQQISEPVARLPFALAGILGLVPIYGIGVWLGGRRAGVWATGMMAISGFHVAFGRIVQYQSLVLLFSATGLYLALAYTELGRRRDLCLCAAFLGLGLLSHTDTLFGAAPSAYVLLAYLTRRREPMGSYAALLAVPVALLLVVSGAFYVPYLLHPYAQIAGANVAHRFGRPPLDNMGHLLDIGTVYNSVYYLAALACGLVYALARHLARSGAWGRWAALGSFGLVASTWAAPRLWQSGGHSFVGGAYLLLVVLVFWALGTRTDVRAVLLWFSLPFIAYVFLFDDPRTHVHVMIPGACLLIGAALAESSLWTRCQWAFTVPVACVAGLSIGYLALVFLNHRPEYVRTYPAYRRALYWTSYGEALPEHGLFGFPYRAGWKAIGVLYSQGVLEGDYATNEETHITGWYTRSAPACATAPRYWFVAQNVQDERPITDALASDYALVGRVLVEGEARLQIWERRPVEPVCRDYRLENYVSAFDRDLAGLAYVPTIPRPDPTYDRQYVMDVRFGQEVTLIGYSVAPESPRVGQTLMVTLYWQAQARPEASYAAYVHLEQGGRLVAQMDSDPNCGLEPTFKWTPTQVVRDPHPIVLPLDMAVGEYQIMVGMYARGTGERLPVFDAEGRLIGDQVDLSPVMVEVR